MIADLLEFRRDRVGLFERRHKEHGEHFVLRFLHRTVHVSSSPEHARIILQERPELFEKGPVVRTFARKLLGDGLVSVDNAAHPRRRRLVAAGFAHKRIAEYAEIFRSETERATAALPSTFDVHEEMLRLSLAIVGHALFSVDLHGDAKALGDAMQTVLRHVSRRIEQPFSLPWNKELTRAIAVLDEKIGALIRTRRVEGSKGDLLSDLVFAEGQALSDKEVRDEVMTLFAAGHETVANALTWTLALVLGDEAQQEAIATSQQAARQAVEEAMRLYPPVHTLGREAVGECDLGNLTLKKGAIIVISTYLMHRRADLFADPLAFKPERTLPRHAYLPFGAGPRACIGAGFALVQAPLVLQTLLAKVRLRPAAPVSLVPEMLVTLRPRDPIRASVQR